MLVLAGPGSGKTAVITQRTLNLIEEHHVNPANILVITFTQGSTRDEASFFASGGKRKKPRDIWNVSCGFLYGT